MKWFIFGMTLISAPAYAEMTESEAAVCSAAKGLASAYQETTADLLALGMSSVNNLGKDHEFTVLLGELSQEATSKGREATLEVVEACETAANN